MRKILILSLLSVFGSFCFADVAPLIKTEWGQSGQFKMMTPLKNGNKTNPGCTTIAMSQLLYYYQYQNHANSSVNYILEHSPLTGEDVIDNCVIESDLAAFSYNWDNMALKFDSNTSQEEKLSTTTFIYHVALTLNAQFGGGEGSSANGKQIENAFRYQWGFNNKARRKMSIVSKEAFNYDNEAWENLMIDELDKGRPVYYVAMAADSDAGHAFLIDGYRTSPKDSSKIEVHVNFGWAGFGNGYYDANTLEDPLGRKWNRGSMIYRELEPEEGYALKKLESEGLLPTYVQVKAEKSGEVGKDEWIHFGPYTNNGGELSVIMTGTGDADLYIRKGSEPTEEDYDIRPYEEGTSERGTLSGSGDYFISVRGYESRSEFKLDISYNIIDESSEGIDLVIDSLVIDKPNLNIGETLKMDVVIKNTGTINSLASNVKYYLSSDVIFDETDKYLNYDNIDAVSAGMTASETSNKVISQAIIDSIGGGNNAYIITFVDTKNTNSEIDETNNYKAVPITFN